MVRTTLYTVSANVQGLGDNRKRLQLFTHYSKTSTADLFLLSETNCFTTSMATQWTQDALQLGLGAIFSPQSKAAILWRLNSHILQAQPTQINLVSSTLWDGAQTADCLFQVGTLHIRIMSVYVPVSLPAKTTFLEDLRRALTPHSTALLLGGDWNCVPAPQLDSTNPHGSNSGHLQMEHLVQSLHLVDAFRSLHPLKQIYTNRGSNGTERRLDRFYLSPELTGSLAKFGLWARSNSTHNPITMDLAVPGLLPTGPGSWKLGLHLLKREGFVAVIQDLIPKLHSSSQQAYPLDPFLAWDNTKHKLASHLSCLSRQFAHWDRTWGVHNSTIIRAGKALRARLPMELSGDSSINIRLRQIRESDLVPCLVEDNITHTSPEDMLTYARHYYSTLYKSKPTSADKHQTLLQHQEASIKPGKQALLEAEVTLEELHEAATACQRSKSPGSDGLPLEFYLATWAQTGPILLELVNLIPSRGSLSPSQSHSHLHLPHKSGAKDLLTNRRPLALLNTDARIMSQAANRRLAPLLQTLTKPSQTGFVPKRWIGTNIGEMQCLMDDAPSLSGMVAVVDFEKAYDRVSHDYIDACLASYGFGPRFLAWLKATYTGQQASVFLNGWISVPFSILSGVRQGDPVAPAIFALCIEPLACQIRKSIQGIQRPFLSPFKECLHADDLACGLKDKEDLLTFNSILNLYSEATAGVLNVRKSFLYPMGQVWGGGPSLGNWKVVHKPFRYLGITVGSAVDPEAEWHILAARVSARLAQIPMYDLPLATRCAIVNRYCYSKVFYFDTFLPCPANIMDTMEQAALAAIWKGHTKRSVSTKRLQQPFQHGGFGLIPLALQFQGPRAKWIFDLLQSTAFHWPHLLRHRCNLSGYLLQHKYVKTKFNPSTLVSTQSTYQWVGPFCQGGSLDVQWPQATMALVNLLPPRWQTYLEAWTALTTFKANTPTHWDFLALNPSCINLKYQFPMKHFSGPENCTVESTMFLKLRETLVLAQSQPIVPPGWQKHFPAMAKPKRWHAYWKKMAQLRWKIPEAVDVAHNLSLYTIHPGHHTGRPQNLFPNSTTKICQLCLDPTSTEDFSHLFVSCPCSAQIWESAKAPSVNPPQLSDLICPSPHPPKPTLAFRYFYVTSIWRLVQSRRWSSQPLQPLDLATLVQKGKALRIAWCSARLSGASAQLFE